MFRMGPVHAWDNSPGASGAEPECTARYRDLLYARTGVGYRRSHRNRPRGYAYLAAINIRSKGASIPHEISGGRHVNSQECGHTWHDMITINMKLFRTHQFPPNPVQVVLSIICYVIINLGNTRSRPGLEIQEYKSTCTTGIQVTVYNTDNSYMIPINVIITGQVLAWQVASDK